MSDHVDIPDLGKKIMLVLRSGRSEIKTEQQLIHGLGIGKDFWSRIKSGTRVLAEERFVDLCDILKIEQKEWYHPLLDFGRERGLSRHEISLITNTPLPGFDFSSRLKDDEQVQNLFRLMEGYWESFYYSVSKTDKIVVSRDLFIVRRVNEDTFIECEVEDSIFRYKGWCFPIKNHLYLVLEKENLYNEIIVYATNLPDREPPRLFGIILCLSGGVDEMHSFPCAAKVAFRYIGRSDTIRQKYGLPRNIDIEDWLVRNIPGYVDPNSADLDDDTKRIIESISNVLVPGVVPSALRADK